MSSTPAPLDGPSALTVEWIDGGSVNRWIPSDSTDALSIGRDASCDLCLDPDDRGLSRRAAWIHSQAGQWWLTNLSGSRPIAVREPTGLPSVLPVGGGRVVDRSPLTFVLTGLVRRHAIRVTLTPGPGGGAVGGGGDQDAAEPTIGLPMPSPVERLALAALVEGYLHDFPRWDPAPRSYAAAAQRLGLPASTVRKRVEAYRVRLRDTGLTSDEVADGRDEVATLVLGSGLLTTADLALLTP